MNLALASVLLLSPASAWISSVISSPRSSSLSSVEGSGMNNGYVPASGGDGGQGQFGAISPSEWKQPGTGPVGENSFGKSDGGDEPWFSEAVSTVFMDPDTRDTAYKAFTAEALAVKMASFEAVRYEISVARSSEGQSDELKASQLLASLASVLLKSLLA